MEELRLVAKGENLNTVLSSIRRCLKNRACNEEDMISILVSAEEVYINIVHYAYPGVKNPEVRMKIDVMPHLCRMTFIDSGIPYNPLEREDPDITLDSKTRPIGGLGIFMVKDMMDRVTYRYEEKKNILTLEKEF